MKIPLWMIGLCSLIAAVGCTSESASLQHAGKLTQPTVVEAACGQCLFGLKEKRGCDLAVRMDGNSYFVDGIKMRDLGDAHADDGMCNAIRKAKVTGHVENGRFVATSFDLLPLEE